MTRVRGKLFDENGSMFQEFETAFSPNTGEYVGSKGTHADGTVNANGIYEEEG